jgi:alcohol dehydrogenase class IV
MALALGLKDTRAENLVNYLFELNQAIGLPVKLREIGVKKEDLNQLTELALADFCHPNNPKPVSRDDFWTLYNEAY